MTTPKRTSRRQRNWGGTSWVPLMGGWKPIGLCEGWAWRGLETTFRCSMMASLMGWCTLNSWRKRRTTLCGESAPAPPARKTSGSAVALIQAWGSTWTKLHPSCGKMRNVAELWLSKMMEGQTLKASFRSPWRGSRRCCRTGLCQARGESFGTPPRWTKLVTRPTIPQHYSQGIQRWPVPSCGGSTVSPLPASCCRRRTSPTPSNGCQWSMRTRGCLQRIYLGATLAWRSLWRSSTIRWRLGGPVRQVNSCSMLGWQSKVMPGTSQTRPFGMMRCPSNPSSLWTTLFLSNRTSDWGRGSASKRQSFARRQHLALTPSTRRRTKSKERWRRGSWFGGLPTTPEGALGSSHQPSWRKPAISCTW